MKEEKFKIIQFIKEFILKIEKELDNFPKKDIEIKNRIRTNAYDLLELAYASNTIDNKPMKIELIQKLIGKIKVIDFLMDLSYEKQLITNKKLVKLGLKLDDIIRYATGWLKKIQAENN